MSDEEKIPKKKHTGLKVFLIIFIVLILIAISLIIGGYFYIQNEKNNIQIKNANSIKEIQETIEYGSSISYEELMEKLVASSELAENSTIEIKINDEVFSPSEEYIFEDVGNVTIKITINCNKVLFLNQNIVSQKEFTWEIVDTKNPVLSGVQDAEITEGDTFDVKQGITAKDEVDGDLEIIVEGEFDANKAGTYTLTAKAVDKNQNETTQEFTVTVKEKAVTPSPKPTTNGNTSNSKKPSSSSGSSGSSSSGNSSSSGTSSSGSSSSGNTSSGNSGNTSPESTLAGRLSLAQAEAKRVVSRIITPGMTNYEKAKAICYYITDTVSVQSDQSLEAYKTNFGNEAYAALILKKAACSGRCKAVTLMCNAAGLQSKHINANKWEHQWNEIQMEDGTWIEIDSQIGYVEDYPKK